MKSTTFSKQNLHWAPNIFVSITNYTCQCHYHFLPIAHLYLNEFHPETPTNVSSFSTYPSHAFLSSKEQLCELNESIILFVMKNTSYIQTKYTEN